MYLCRNKNFPPTFYFRYILHINGGTCVRSIHWSLIMTNVLSLQGDVQDLAKVGICPICWTNPSISPQFIKQALPLLYFNVLTCRSFILICDTHSSTRTWSVLQANQKPWSRISGHVGSPMSRPLFLMLPNMYLIMHWENNSM